MDPKPSTPLPRQGWPKKAPPRVSLDLCETPPAHYSRLMSENFEVRSPVAAGALQVKPKIRTTRVKQSLIDLNYAERNLQDVPMSPLVQRGGPRKSLASSMDSSARSPYSRSLSRNRRSTSTILGHSPKNNSRKAVLIHVCYANTEGVHSLRSRSSLTSLYDLLVSRLGFARNNIWVLTDEPKSILGAVNFTPTRANIINSLRWLVKGSSANHELLLCFSGHGCRMSKKAVPVGSFDDCILPSDYPVSNPISETEMKDILIQNLNFGATITTLFDCQNSARLLSLPYIHVATKGAKATFFLREELELPKTVNASVHGVVLNSVLRFSKLKKSADEKRTAAEKKRDAHAASCFDNGTVICISMSFEMEYECSSISSSPPNHGFLTYAFVQYLKHSASERSKPSYTTALCAMSAWLFSQGSSLPQFSSTHNVSPDKTISLL